MTTPHNKGSVATYSAGFIISVILTLAAYFAVREYADTSSPKFLIFIVICLALAQLLVQLQFFIHLGQESKPRWNKLMFLSMLGVLLIVVIGSLWIMNNLNYHMSPQETEIYIIKDEGIKQ